MSWLKERKFVCKIVINASEVNSIETLWIGQGLEREYQAKISFVCEEKLQRESSADSTMEYSVSTQLHLIKYV
jgi:hypothetical protein